jgi:uncharacterized protein YdaU (DUF1376 family)
VKRAPYTPWYHGDFLRSTAGWTLLERAAYWMLLNAQWEAGPLPNDMARLAAILGTDVPTLMTVWPMVGKKFKSTKAGLVNRRMTEHKANFDQHRARLSDNGKKGMRARWGDRGAKVVPFRGPGGGHE